MSDKLTGAPAKGSRSDVDSALLAAIVNSSNDAIIGKSTKGVVRSWNKAATRVFGYQPEEMIGNSIRILIPADRQNEEDDILARITRGEQITNFETIRLRKDGTPINVSITISPIHGPDGKVVGASKIARDITEQVTMREKLRASQERFRTLADNISHFAWMADKDGYIFWYNKRWHDYTGQTLEQSKGWGWRDVHHPDHLDRVVARLQHSWDTGEPWEDTFPLRGADGGYRWFLSRAVPIRDENGEIALWFGSNTDVTEQREREEQIRMLMYEVNHRAKNLLGLVQSIARQSAGDEESEFLSRFCSRLQALAANQDVLIKSDWRGGDVETLVRSQLDHFSDLIGDRIQLKGPPVMLKAAAAQTLGLALHELATNAAKYGALSNQTGRVRIAWRVSSGRKGGRFAIEWSESGGPEVAPPSRKGFGSAVIERMSTAALGAEVTFDFPPTGLRWRLECQDAQALEDGESLADAAARNGGEEPNGRKRVLVVEDDAIIGMDLAEKLEEAGYRVIGPAAGVAEALGLLKEYPCDMAVLDIHLGEETSEPVALHLIRQNTPFVTLSGYSRAQRPKALKEAPHLSKPLQPRLLFATLDRFRNGEAKEKRH